MCTSHLVHSGDDLTQGVHQSFVLQWISFLQTELLPLGLPTVLRRPPAGKITIIQSCGINVSHVGKQVRFPYEEMRELL